MGYFFWLKDNISTTKVAKETANISESSIGISTTSFPGSEPTTLEHLFYYYAIISFKPLFLDTESLYHRKHPA
jgi:hypothetical protein